ncbi:unnamed protein product [Prunus armeniaca]
MNFHTLIAKNGGRRREIEAGEVSSENRLFPSFFRRNLDGWRRGLAGVGRGRPAGHLGPTPPQMVAGGSGGGRKTAAAVLTEEARSGGMRGRERERAEGFSDVYQNPLRNSYGFATSDVLLVTSSLRLRFKPSTCLRTRLSTTYATKSLVVPKSYDRGVTVCAATEREVSEGSKRKRQLIKIEILPLVLSNDNEVNGDNFEGGCARREGGSMGVWEEPISLGGVGLGRERDEEKLFSFGF